MPKKKKITKKLKKFSMDTRLKSANEFKNKLLGLFKDYIKSVVIFGSFLRGQGTGKSDVDVYVIFDDTKMPLKKFDEIRPKIDADIFKIARETDPRLHPQPILALTEFWDGIRNTHPLFYNIVREGYAIHDTGFFIPMRKLLEWGKFPATVEAAELRMSTVPKRVERVKNIKSLMIAEDLYNATIDAAQSVLMFVGVGPPAPKNSGRELRKHFVDHKMLEQEYVDFVEDIFTFRKKIEHKEYKGTMKGKELDKWIERTEKYVKRMHKLLKQLEFERKAVDVQKNYEVMVKATVAALKAVNKLPPDPKNLPKAFDKYLIGSGLVNPLYGDVFSQVVEMRKMLQDKKLHEIPDKDVNLTKEYVRRFIINARRVIDFKDKIDVDDMIEKHKQKLTKISDEKMSKAEGELKTVKEVKKMPVKKKKNRKLKKGRSKK